MNANLCVNYFKGRNFHGRNFRDFFGQIANIKFREKCRRSPFAKVNSREIRNFFSPKFSKIVLTGG